MQKWKNIKDGGWRRYLKVTVTSNVFPSDYLAVYFVNNKVGFASREHSYLYKTTDGGETWQEIPDISDAIYSFFFLNENTGYIAGKHGVVFKTIDGGKSWNWAGFQAGRID